VALVVDHTVDARSDLVMAVPDVIERDLLLRSIDEDGDRKGFLDLARQDFECTEVLASEPRLEQLQARLELGGGEVATPERNGVADLVVVLEELQRRLFDLVKV